MTPKKIANSILYWHLFINHICSWSASNTDPVVRHSSGSRHSEIWISCYYLPACNSDGEALPCWRSLIRLHVNSTCYGNNIWLRNIQGRPHLHVSVYILLNSKRDDRRRYRAILIMGDLS